MHKICSNKGKIYRIPLVQYSYRDEQGTPRHKTVVSLSKLPEIVVKVIYETLKRGDRSILEELVPKSQTQFKYSFNVGDRGMVTNDARIEELGKDGWWDTFSYVTALKRQEVFYLIDDSSHPLQPELFDHRDLVELDHNGERYVLCHNPCKCDADRQVRESLLEKTEEKLKMIDSSVKSGRLKSRDKIARRLYRWINKWNMKRFSACCMMKGSLNLN